MEINGVKSDFKTLKYGVPQGTVLGPLLFVIYINDLFQIDSAGDILSFADDTVVYYVDSTWNCLKQKVEKDFLKLKKWFDNKILTLNLQKTFFLPFASYKPALPTFEALCITDQNSTLYIQKADKIKYLGIYIDSNLKWDLHIEYFVKKLRSLIPIFKHITDILPLNNNRTIYYALVESHINYGILGWGGVNKVYLHRLETTQKRLLKIIFKKNPTFPSDELFSETKIFDTRQLFYYAICLNQLKNQTKLNNIAHHYITRQNSEKFRVDFMRKTLGQRNYTYLSPKIYSVLPENIRKLKSLYVFKKRCKNFIRITPRENIHRQIDFKNFHFC